MAEVKSKEDEKVTKKTAIGCGVLLAIVIIISVCIVTRLSNSDVTESKLGQLTETEVALKAEVVYDLGQFIITNNDSFAWTDVKFALNYATLSSTGELTEEYTYYASYLDANVTCALSSTQFTRSDGTRFNPFAQKPLMMFIHCKTPDGKDGWWFGRWK